MQEMEDLLSMASKLGGELMWNGTDFPPLNAKTPSLIIDDTIPEPIPPPYDTTPLEEEPDWSEIPFVE